MKQSLRSRVSAFVMALVMVFSLIPTTAFAADSVTATLVTNVSELTAGDQVVIVAKDYDYALSTNQRSNNRGAIAVTKDGSSIDLPSDIQLLTLEAGTKEGTFAFNTGSGYLYAASSSSNYLRTQTSKNDNSSWKISIAADGTASVVAQGSNTRATMQYNPNNGTPLFACYSSASQKAIAIYKLSTSSGGGSETPDPEVPTIVPISTALAGADGTEFTVKGVVTLLDGKNVYLQDATGGICVRMSADFTDLALGDTVIGTGAKSVYNGLTQLGSGTYEKSSGMTLTAKETTIGALTSADIGTYIALKGVEVTEVYDNNGAYSTPNITVTDGTNTIQLYKAVVGKTDGAWDVKVGDKLDVKAAVSVYNTTLQLRNTVADEITKVSAPIERQSGFITDLSTLQAGDQVVIFNTANGKILSQNPSYSGSYYNGGVDGTVTDGVLSGYTDTEIWVLTKTADGSYTIATADGKKLSMDTGFSSTPFDKVNDTWNIVPVSGKEGFYTIENVGRSGQKLQWRAGTYNYFSCYTGSGTAYEYQLYLVVNTSGEGGETPDPEVPEVTYADKMTALPNDGDIIIIYNSGNAMGSAASGKKLAAVAAEVTDNKLPIADGMAQLLVTIDEDGKYLFTLDGKYLTSGNTGNSLSFAEELTDCGKWTMETATDGTWYIKNVGANYNGNYNQALEYYSGFTTYGIKQTAIYQMELYLVKAAPQYPVPDGDYVIWAPAYNMALSTNYSGYYNAGTAVSLSGDKLTGYTAAEIWTVKNSDDGSITISTADGKKLSMGASYSSMPLDDVNTAWTLEDAGNGLFYVKNAARGSYIEWYASKNNWSGYNYINSGSEGMFALKFTPAEAVTTGGLPTAGSQVVIYNQNAKGVLAAENDTQSINNVMAQIEDGKARPANGGVVFTVEKNGNYFRFVNETYGYLCSNGTGNNAFYSKTASEDADWTLETLAGGYKMLSRTAKYNGTSAQYLEYYADSYKTYSFYATNKDGSAADTTIYEFHFYGLADGVNVNDGIVNMPVVDFGTLTDAYVGMDYTFSVTVDAVFGVDGALEVTVNGEAVAAGEDGSYTVPAEKVTGEKLEISVTGVDTKGVNISGSAEVSVKDEPAIGVVTPAAGVQTLENKRPVISAEISNAKEGATITMTVNGETVEATFADGVLTYIPAADMADGRTSVTVTVVRADGKEATKTWSFTVGKAQYQLYFGQLHSHTTYSDGSGSLESALDYIKNLPDSANVDFVAFTDHSNYFDASGAANPEAALYDMSQATANSQKLWSEYKGAIADFNASQSDVVAIGGFEMTWSGGPGHINTFNTPGIVSRNNTTLNNKTSDAGMKAYYALLSQAEGVDSLSQFNHPGSTFGTFSDFAYWDAVVDTRIQMVEVGNGEGQVGAGGYYPSYEYYTMALDKGWHVAPTNNQDNHKGKWGNANDARDVVLTDDFSEEGIYQAIRDMRMYSTEDKNLEIGYTVNGLLLGSSITEVPEKLNIDVTVYDPDKSDSISKVEVIVNSGKVAYTWDDPAALATGQLSVTLDPSYSYYYIRVTQGDGDLAVTAPVWVGESLKLGISGVECTTSTPVTDEKLTINTTLFNSESADATVKSLTYAIKGGEVIGTDTTGYTLNASSTKTVSFDYTPTTARVMTVTVTAVVELDGEEYTFTMDIELDVQDADKLVYIGIDASHYNEYVNGNYKDSMGNFSALAAEYNVRTVTLYESADLIAACANPKYKALILTAPSRRSAEAQAADPLKVYTAEELAAIDAFNQAGGMVILAGWSDHYENYPDVASIKNMKAEEHMAATQNAVLEALGSSLRIGDDATYDDDYNGGQAYRLYFNAYGDSFLTEGVEVDPAHPHDRLYTEVFSHYGGASVYTVPSALPATVEPVVFGHSGTYSVDVDKDGLGGSSMPKYAYAEGDNRLMIMATEQLEGRGLIIVSGAAFMSNFEVQATIEDSGSEKNYSNYKICENLLAMINPTVITPIAEVQAQTEIGYKYTIEGVVTSNASGYDKDTAFFDCIYVQDATGGICCFPVAGNFKIGDQVRVTGTTEFYQGEMELQVTSIEVIGEGSVEAKEVSAKEINDLSVIGQLITVKGTVESYELANGLVQTIMVKDADGNVARVFIDGYITTGKEVANLIVGHEITVTGIASYDNTFNAPEGPFPRIRIRDRADVVIAAEHTEVVDEAKAPTCTETGLTEGKHCSACGEVLVKQEVVAALGHSYKDGKCTVCGAVDPEYQAPQTGDTFQPVLWLSLMALTTAAGAVMIALRRKEQQ
ncbi:MAG: CehA/McbA family metallohydrolase [Oscillospiraceae bacterium]|nr:CehA/McbA family metallohydrolase [Oscillospiraceae bacterium]